jgi:hypothetical protein
VLCDIGNQTTCSTDNAKSSIALLAQAAHIKWRDAKFKEKYKKKILQFF